MQMETTCNPSERGEGARNRASKLLVSFAVLACLVTIPAFAGGSSRTEPQTFGSYQVDFDAGPIAITIHGHASTQVVKISEDNIPAGVTVHYSEAGGILHVTASYSGDPKTAAKGTMVGQLTASMPRYEFVHIKTSSGAVSIDNLSTNHLTIQTDSGAVDVVNTNAALKVQSTTGDQKYKQIYGAIDANSTTGNMAIDHTWGVIKFQSHSGSVQAQDVDLAGNSSFRTDTGSIKVGMTYGLSRYRYLFDLRSATGKLRLGDIVRNGGDIRWGEGNIRIAATTGTGSQDFQ